MPRKPRRPSRPVDTGYKRLFGHRELVADLIRGYLDPRLARTFDLSSLERCNGSYVAPDLRERRSDLVWRMRSPQGWTYVYLLIEFQSTVDRYMAVRMLGYVSLLWQDLIAQRQVAAGGLLPAVVPIVLYNGDQPWNAPLELRQLIAPAPAFLAALQPTMSYRFLDENRVPTTGGARLRNLSAAIFALEQSSDLPSQQRVLHLLRAWLCDRPDLRESIGTWYAEALAPTGLITGIRRGKISIDEVEPMMATRIMQDIRRQVAEGEALGMARGEARGEARGMARGEARGMARGEAQGMARGKAEGMVTAIRQLVNSGVLSVDAARAQVKALLKSQQIPAKFAKEALAKLG